MMIGAIGSFGGAGGLAAWQQMQFTHRMRNVAAASAAEPVEPVQKEAPARATAAAAGGGAAAGALPFGPSELPYVPEGYGPVELATRTRIQFPDLGEEEKWQTFPDEDEDLNGDGKVSDAEKAKSAADELEEGKCETCEKRKYKDGSDDPGVSFKTAQRVDPRVAQAAVRGHEMEHVVRERAKAQREGRKVVSQSVTYHTGVCPECGKFYVSGGTTRTVTAPDNSKDILELLRSDSKGLGVSA